MGSFRWFVCVSQFILSPHYGSGVDREKGFLGSDCWHSLRILTENCTFLYIFCMSEFCPDSSTLILVNKQGPFVTWEKQLSGQWSYPNTRYLILVRNVDVFRARFFFQLN